jgi:hypothetical protein
MGVILSVYQYKGNDKSLYYGKFNGKSGDMRQIKKIKEINELIERIEISAMDRGNFKL